MRIFAALLALAIAACSSDSADRDVDVDATSDASTDTVEDSDATPTDAPTDVWEPPPARDLTRYVDPFIGTDGGGNVIPGALLPHGVVRASPVTNSGEGQIDAYEHGDGAFYGFAHMHLEGPGGSGNGYGHVVLRPLRVDVADAFSAAPAVLDPETESAAPGYYSVRVDDTLAEVTATQWAAAHRYTFAGDGPRTVLFDLAESRGESIGGEVTRDGNRLLGSARYQVHPAVAELVGDGTTGRLTVYFALDFGAEPAALSAFDRNGDASALADGATVDGRELRFAARFDGDTLEPRIGLSLIDAQTAAAHLDALSEVGDGSFDGVAEAAEATWNARLNRVQAEGADEDLTRFYTALYHAMFQPADYSEGDTFASAWDGVQSAYPLPEGRRYVTDDWCLWDTFRTSHPLRTLVEPDLVDDIVFSSLHAYRTGGWLPKCPWAAGGYSRVMTGNPQAIIVADAVVRGFDGFDRDDAVAAVRKTSESDSNPFPAGLCGYFGLGTPAEYLSLGYVPHECDPTQSASTTFEVAHADWAIARMAEFLGDDALAATYDERADSWRIHWDDETGFPRGMRRDGSWVEPFDPADMSDTNDFVEASAWIFAFGAPHDVSGMIEVHGGEEPFVAKLDAFFAGDHFDPTNQPSFHIPFLYAHAGRPDRTAEQVHATMADAYGTGRDGLPGNDDAGSTSAWFVLAAAGLYPLAPGDTAWTVTPPLLDRITFVLDPVHQAAATLTIETEGDGAYIDRIEWNGESVDGPTIDHATLVGGGTLRVHLTTEP